MDIMPKYLPAWLTLGVMSLSALFRVDRNTSREHYARNARLWQSVRARIGPGGFIEDQTCLSELAYGRQRPVLSRRLLGGRPLTAAENTCEVLAVYNAQIALGERPELPELLRRFERGGAALWGYFGTSVRSLGRFFRKNGRAVRFRSGFRLHRAGVDRMEAWGKTFIAVLYNDRESLMQMIHTVCLTKEDGRVRIHNGGAGPEEYPSVYEALRGYNGGRGKALALLAVGEKRKGRTDS